jgi:hypothetical protein
MNVVAKKFESNILVIEFIAKEYYRRWGYFYSLGLTN